MAEFHRQQTFGPPTFIDLSASGNSSGLDQYDTLDGAQLYHEHNYRTLPQPLQTPEEGYAHGQFAYPSHSSVTDVSLPGLQFTSSAMNGHSALKYDYESSILDDMNGFSPIAPNFTMNAYRAPYPDSNASATSSATSPDPNPGLISDPVIVEADEDKRKRNQAASARFRQKKKQREQQLLEASREMQDRTKKLEAENDSLRKENQFLKKLLVEKVDHMNEEDREMLTKVTTETLKLKK